MNIYGVVILAALLVNFVVGAVSDLLNMRALRRPLPEELAGLYEADAYAKSQEYTGARTRLGLLQASFDLVLLLVFWFSGGFNYLDTQVHALGYGPLVSGLLYIGALLLAKVTLALPFSFYSTFVLEERFGFNRTTVAVFAADFCKGLLLGVLLGGPLVAAVLFLFEWGGPGAWIYGWLVTAVFLVFVQFVAPSWIMPIFNTFTPLEDGELKGRIMAYADSVAFPLENVFVMDGSRRSSKSNAFFTGFGRHKRIALFDTLIQRHSVSELVAVLAHEIGHYKKRHIQQGLVLSVLHMGALLFLLSIFMTSQGLFEAFYMEQGSVHAGLIFFGLLLTPLDMVLSVLLNALSRRNEFEADRFAARTWDGSALVSALKKLAVDNLSNLTPHWFHVFLHYSHPPLLQRIKALNVG